MFQFGDFYYSASNPNYWTMIGTFLGPIVSVIITICVFKATIKKEKRNEKERLDILKKQIEKYIELIDKYLKEQVSYLSELLENIQEKKLQNYEYKEVQHIEYYIQKFSEVNQIELYKIFIEKDNEKLNALLNLQESISTINQLLAFSKREFQLFISRYDECQRLYNENIQEISNYITTFIKEYTERLHYEDFNSSLVKIFENYTSISDKDYRDIYVSFECLISKIREEYTNQEQTNSVLNNYLTNCEYAFRDLVAYKAEYRKHLIFSIRGINKFRILLVGKFNELNNKNRR